MLQISNVKMFYIACIKISNLFFIIASQKVHLWIEGRMFNMSISISIDSSHRHEFPQRLSVTSVSGWHHLLQRSIIKLITR